MLQIKASDLVEIDEEFINRVSNRLKEIQDKKELENPYYSTNEVGEILKVTRLTVVRYINSYLDPNKYPLTQRLKAVKAGKSWLIRKSDLEIYLRNPKNPDYNEQK
jgi:hypothetical protein